MFGLCGNPVDKRQGRLNGMSRLFEYV